MLVITEFLNLVLKVGQRLSDHFHIAYITVLHFERQRGGKRKIGDNFVNVTRMIFIHLDYEFDFLLIPLPSTDGNRGLKKPFIRQIDCDVITDLVA